MIKRILLGLAALIVIFLIVVSLQSSDYRVERKAALAAAPDALFERVNDPRHFAVWNPWLGLDPNVEVTYSGPASGVGAACSWQGKSQVGAGTSTISESKLHDLIRFNTDWKEPMAGTNTTDFHFTPDGDQTVVTVAMYGPKSFMAKAVGLFIDCDKMHGDQLEKGLAALEASASVTPTK